VCGVPPSACRATPLQATLTPADRSRARVAAVCLQGDAAARHLDPGLRRRRQPHGRPAGCTPWRPTGAAAGLAPRDAPTNPLSLTVTGGSAYMLTPAPASPRARRASCGARHCSGSTTACCWRAGCRLGMCSTHVPRHLTPTSRVSASLVITP